ncbi:MAG: hypothetical protein MUP49_04135 [Dehalococcoidia bacterium]|nr:hypothetical protein [Dehalococcoidia bacterium]
MLAIIGKWALAIGFLGIVLSIIVQFAAFSSAEKKKYRPYLVAALVFTAFATVIQMALLV